MRTSGILMPVFSLASNYGIGTFGKEAREFVLFLKAAGQSYWQLLPLNPTSFGDSPYQSFSSYAGNPYFIDLDMLKEDGLLKKEEYENIDFGTHDRVDYEKLYFNRYPVLRKAFLRFDRSNKKYIDFIEKERDWLDTYALFMAIKDKNNGESRHNWPKEFKKFDLELSKLWTEELKEDIDFYKFLQFKFFEQWFSLKEYANKNGIKIIGDMPIYVADDSVDVWSNPEQFSLLEDLKPKEVAGCPPDAFCVDGQLWGNPVYDWDYMKSEKRPFSWWRNRFAHAFRVYDVIRIDHFRGFESYYCIDAKSLDAKKGIWKKGPDMALFKALEEDFGKDLPIIAEDLGMLTPAVQKLLEGSGYPGMKVLQFAFSLEKESSYLPHNHIKNCVVYTGTHDNDTIVGWADSITDDELKFASEYMGKGDNESINWAMIRTALSSVADTVIIPMADLLGLSSEGRINTPSVAENNWQWRIGKGCVNDWLAGILKEKTKLYKRCK